MDLKNSKYVILEIIPTSPNPKTGDVAQISALKVDGVKLLERFDYRLDKSLVKVPDVLKITNYDNDSFKYVKTTKLILDNFKKFVSDLPLLIIENDYTRSYLEGFDNDVYSVFSFLNMSVSDDVFERLISKYNLEPTNHLVDLLYEALVQEI